MHKQRVAGLLAEIAIGVAIVIIAVLYATYGPFSWMPQRKWITLTVVTSGTFGVPVWWYRKCWSRAAFWACFSALLVAHIAGFCILLERISEFPPMLWAISLPAEWLVIFPILRRTNRATPTRNSTDRGPAGAAR